MKKTFIIILLIFLILVAFTYIFLTNLVYKQRNIKKINLEYEYYLNKKIYGTELVTLINKAIDYNEKNKLAKDDRNYYIENEINSIKIDIKMKETGKTYAMEEIQKNNITEFIKYFNLTKFECTSITYHEKTKQVSKMIFEETN